MGNKFWQVVVYEADGNDEQAKLVMLADRHNPSIQMSACFDALDDDGDVPDDFDEDMQTFANATGMAVVLYQIDFHDEEIRTLDDWDPEPDTEALDTFTEQSSKQTLESLVMAAKVMREQAEAQSRAKAMEAMKMVQMPEDDDEPRAAWNPTPGQRPRTDVI